MHEYGILNFVHTFINNNEKLHTIFSSYFAQSCSIHYYDTRRKCDLHRTGTLLTVGKKSITSKGCILWNKLPDNIKTIKSNKTFKRRLKRHYLELM